jgi:hypothetical protein
LNFFLHPGDQDSNPPSAQAILAMQEKFVADKGGIYNAGHLANSTAVNWEGGEWADSSTGRGGRI